MALLSSVKGIGKRSGIFFLGAPAHLLTLDDGVVFLRQGTVQGLVAGQGVVGAAAGVAATRKQEKGRDAQAPEMTTADFADNKRAQVIPNGDITSVRLEPSKLKQRNIIIETASGPSKLRYPSSAWPDADATALLTKLFGERFKSQL
jgi:hypothetical protein